MAELSTKPVEDLRDEREPHENFFAPNTFYYDQLPGEEQSIYRQIRSHIKRNESFLLNVPQTTQPSRIAHAFNLDNIFCWEGKIVNKGG